VPLESTDDRAPLAATLEQVLRGRRSIRAYRPEPLPRPLLEEVLAAAAYAPSPHHSALWRAAVLTRPEARAALAQAMGAAWRRDLVSTRCSPARARGWRARRRS
jgi:nitroreductase